MTPRIDPHLKLIGTLFLIAAKVRREGLMAIEEDVEAPRASPLFTLDGYDEANDTVYVFVTDTLRVMVAGTLEPDHVERYMAAARATAAMDPTQSSLFDTASLFIRAWCRGLAPQVAAEFARHGIPHSVKPGCLALEDFLRFWRVAEDEPRPVADVDAALEGFFASLRG